jgi:hypothetical protein
MIPIFIDPKLLYFLFYVCFLQNFPFFMKKVLSALEIDCLIPCVGLPPIYNVLFVAASRIMSSHGFGDFVD